MEESVRPEPALRRPGPADDDAPAARTTDPPHLADPRTLTILTTEHWGLLTARSLVYNESFSRGGMFLTFLSASLVALGFVSQGGAGPEFPWVVVLLLSLDLVVGLATMGRLISAGTEEFRALQGINRVRHAYLELVPGVEPYLPGPRYDDVMSVLSAYGERAGNPAAPYALLTLAHGLTTMPGLVGLLSAAVAGGIAATLAIIAGAGPVGAIIAAIAGSAVLTVLLFRVMGMVFRRQQQWLVPRFPAPPRER